ncbi:MAG: tetratricopeptide repeat-containing serine protease family protein [Rhizobiaceae bacterium]|nr:tetratricopeptide repeat-containing serine protease family protein [Rhizobiaceae bacterium]
MAKKEARVGVAGRGLGLGFVIAVALCVSGCESGRVDEANGAAEEPPPEAPQREIGIYGMAMKTPEEIEALKTRATAGDPDAIIEATRTFVWGIGVARDPREALKFARQGAEMGLPEAKVRLARLLLRNDEEGITPNKDEGLRLLNELAAQGNESAVRGLASQQPLEEQDEALIAYDRQYGIKEAASARQIAVGCWVGEAAMGVTDDKAREALTCARTWLDRAEELGDELEAVVIAELNLEVAKSAQARNFEGFGDVGALAELGSELQAVSSLDVVRIARMMLARAEFAKSGTHLPKNAEVAREYAIKATAAEDKRVRSSAFEILWNLHAHDGVSSATFDDPQRLYGWALLTKSVFEPKEWDESGSEKVLTSIESDLSPEDRLAVQRAVADWTPGQDLPLPSPDDRKAQQEGGAEATSSDPVSGTAFLVSDDGFALTNAHVAKECKTIKDTAGGVAALVAMDEANDLAAIRFGSYSERPFARLEAGAKLPRIGDRVAVFGFPLSEVLASTGNLTAGEVSANAGLGNNSSMFQISAPIQPGSSGSPVLSMRGNVAGVISSTASTVRLTQATGAIAQNLNFAINKDTVVGFLRSNGIPFEEAGDGYFSGGDLDVAEVGERVREWTLRIECQR